MEKFKQEVSIKNVKQVMIEYDAMTGKRGIITVTEWANGEGYDFYIGSDHEVSFSLTYEEFNKVKSAALALEYGIDIVDDED